MINRLPLPTAQEKPGRGTRRVVLLAAPPAMEIDIVGPMAVFAAANHLLGRCGTEYEVELATTGEGFVIEGSTGVSLVAHRHYSAIGAGIDTLLVVGGPGALGACRRNGIKRPFLLICPHYGKDIQILRPKTNAAPAIIDGLAPERAPRLFPIGCGRAA